MAAWSVMPQLPGFLQVPAAADKASVLGCDEHVVETVTLAAAADQLWPGASGCRAR